MNNLMEYRGYHAKIEFSAEDKVLIGHVLGINDIISFDGESIPELEAMFHESIDDYLEECAELGIEPDKEYKGTFNVRISPELHRQAVIASEARNISLNQFVQQSIENELSGKHGREQITIIMPEHAIRNYDPLHGKETIDLKEFAEEGGRRQWSQNVKLPSFVS